MAYLTKEDIKVAIDVVWDLCTWAYRGANPMESIEQHEINIQKKGPKDLLTIDREKLRFGKYTRGYSELSSEQLNGLLWLLGEWSCRSSLSDPMGSHWRSKFAFEALLKFSRKPLTLNDVTALMRKACRRH